MSLQWQSNVRDTLYTVVYTSTYWLSLVHGEVVHFWEVRDAVAVALGATSWLGFQQAISEQRLTLTMDVLEHSSALVTDGTLHTDLWNSVLTLIFGVGQNWLRRPYSRRTSVSTPNITHWKSEKLYKPHTTQLYRRLILEHYSGFINLSKAFQHYIICSIRFRDFISNLDVVSFVDVTKEFICVGVST